MSKFSDRSAERLRTCDTRLIDLFNKVVQTYDCTILEGARGQAKQNAAYVSGNSKVRWPNSKHNDTPSKAVDVAPWPLNWRDINRFYYFAGYVQAISEHMSIPVTWGGDWDNDKDFSDQSFLDLVHWEIRESKKLGFLA